MAAVAIILAILIIGMILALYIHHRSRDASLVDRIHMAAKGNNAKNAESSAIESVPIRKDSRAFNRDPIELEKLKQHLKQVKYAHSIGLAKDEDLAKARSELSKSQRDIVYRR